LVVAGSLQPNQGYPRIEIVTCPKTTYKEAQLLRKSP